jgi:methionyl-tRNA formyltransferase
VNVLLLGPRRDSMAEFIEGLGDHVRQTEEKLAHDDALLEWADAIVSYGYRYIVPGEILERFPGRVFNLHISLLPWNRGADPNVWSFLEDTPAGVTIHLMDEGIDTGDILVQWRVTHDPASDTLRTSYERLHQTMEQLFSESWPTLRHGAVSPHPQPRGGTEHKGTDLRRYSHLLAEGWDTPVRGLIGKALEDRESGSTEADS